MKLHAYLTHHQVTDEAFAKVIGKDRTLVGKYRREQVVPPLEIIKKIEIATGGEVSFNDFLTNDAA